MLSSSFARCASQQWGWVGSTSQKASNALMAMMEASANHVSIAHPAVWTVLARRNLSSSSTFTLIKNDTACTTTRKSASAASIRWERNRSRLYARHILHVALLSAATQRFVTQLEELAHISNTGSGNSNNTSLEKPSDWDNWQRKDWTSDLLQSLGESGLQRAWAATRRILNLAILVAPMTVLVPLSYLNNDIKEWTWSYALWSVEQAGPSYIKLTQWATTRQDLFSPEFCWRFGKLRDDTVGHSWHETLCILNEDLGGLGENVHGDYLELDETPIGSGCIAQVYRGRLKKAVNQYPAGTQLAVKVQHPRIWHKVCCDFYIMAKIASFLEHLPYLNLQFLSLLDTVRQFRDMMLPQLDLTLEAKHLDRFNRDFASNDRVSFPHPLHSLTTTRVLTETFMPGIPIMEYTKREESVRKELAALGLTTTLKMIFVHDFLHGDLHPGNLLVAENKETKQLQLHLIDCGLVVEMGPEQHVNLVKILGAFTRRKGRQAAQLMVDSSSNCQASDLDVELFVNGIAQIVKDDENNNFIEKVGDYIADICYLACKHKVKLEASFINAALAVEIMEGIATALNPNIVVTTTALPMVLQAEVMHRLPKFTLW